MEAVIRTSGRIGALGALLGAACVGAPGGHEDSDTEVVAETDRPVDTDSDTDPDTDMDTETPDDTETDPPGDSAAEPDTDAAVDTDPPPPPPPSTWGGGLVDISGPLLGVDAFVVDKGSPAPFRPPQVTTALFLPPDALGGPAVLVSNEDHDPGGLYLHQRRLYRWEASGLVRDRAAEDLLPVPEDAFWGTLDLDGDGAVELLTPILHLARYEAKASGWRAPTPLGIDPGAFIWAGAFAPWDLDRDGLTDLLLADHGCEGTVLPLLADGAGSLTARADLVPSGNRPGVRSGGLLPLPLEDGRTMLLPVGAACDHADPHPGFLVEDGVAADGRPRFTPVDASPVDALWKRFPAWQGQPYTEVMPMGGASADLDGDGHLDLLLTLGFDWVAALQGDGHGGFVDRTQRADLALAPQPWGTTEVPWAVETPDLDQDGRPDIVVVNGDDETSFHLLAGDKVGVRVWWNAGDWRFVDVTDSVGPGLLGSWRGLVLGDPDADGDADLLVGGMGALPRVVRNDIDVGHHGLSLRLRGTTSDPSAAGAVVEVEGDGLPRRVLALDATGNFAGRGEPLLFVGLGASTVAPTVRVRWPSGLVQEVHDLAADQLHTLTEPRVLSLSPASRRTRANGVTVVTVAVTPAALDGSPDPAAAVELVLDGPGDLVGPPVQDGATTTWSIRAPTSPGELVLTVRIDGVPLRVRPRFTWTP